MSAERLESWKEIAAYLGRQVRTVQGWEKQEGLPVHRLPHKKLGTVFAYKREIDAWRAQRAALSAEEPEAEPATLAESSSPPPRPRPVWRRRFAYGVATLVVLAAAVAGWRKLRDQPAPVNPIPVTRRYFVMATSANGHVRRLPAPAGADLLALTPGRRSLVAAGSSSGEIAVIATRSGEITSRWKVPAPLSIALSPDGRDLYTVGGNSLLQVRNLITGHTRSLPLEGAAGGMALSPSGRYLYIALPYAGVDRVDTATWESKHWVLGACPQSLALSPDGRSVFVSFQCGGPGGSYGHDALEILDSATGSPISRMAGPPRVGSALAVSPDGNEVWSNSGSACIAPQFDHRGCPFVPSALAQVFSAAPLHLLRTLATPIGAHLPELGPAVFLPGGERVLDGNFLFSSTRYARLEVLPASFHRVAGAVASRDGAHLYVSLQGKQGSSIADFSPSPAACSPPTRSLADWWPGDGSADDAWGIVHATASSAVRFSPGGVGQAFDLTQPDAYLITGPDPALDFALRNITLAVWVKFASSGAAPILNKTGSWHLERDGAGHARFCPTASRRGAGCVIGSSILTPGVWRHLAVSADGRGALSLYVNGMREGSVGPAQAPPPVHAPLNVGIDPAHHRLLHGWLDEVMLYQRALSAPEINRLALMPACLAAHAGR